MMWWCVAASHVGGRHRPSPSFPAWGTPRCGAPPKPSKIWTVAHIRKHQPAHSLRFHWAAIGGCIVKFMVCNPLQPFLVLHAKQIHSFCPPEQARIPACTTPFAKQLLSSIVGATTFPLSLSWSFPLFIVFTIKPNNESSSTRKTHKAAHNERWKPPPPQKGRTKPPGGFWAVYLPHRLVTGVATVLGAAGAAVPRCCPCVTLKICLPGHHCAMPPMQRCRFCGHSKWGQNGFFLGGGTGHPGLTHTETQRGRLRTACGRRCVDIKNSQTTPATTSTTPNTPTTARH